MMLFNTTLLKKNNSQIIECVGPEVLTFREILEILLNLIEKKIFSSY